MDVTAGGDIEVVSGDFVQGADPGKFFDFLPGFESFGNTNDSLDGEVILWVALGELPAGVEQEELFFSFFGFGLV